MRVHRRWLGAEGEEAPTDMAAQFAGAEVLAAAHGGALSPGAGETLTLALWFALDALPSGASFEVMNVNTGAAATDGWFVFVEDGTNKLGMGYCDGTNYTFLTTGVALEADKWYLAVIGWQNGAGCALSIDLFDTDAFINSYTNSGLNPVNAGANGTLKMGDGAAGQQGLIGRLDKAGFWSRTLTAGELVDLYNAGVGLTGGQVLAHGTLPTGLLAGYDYDEETGATTWPDYTENFDATATGTVVSVPPAGQF